MSDQLTSKKWYPDVLKVGPHGTKSTYEFIGNAYHADSYFHYAEFGVYHGSTAINIAKKFPNAILHLFDYEERLVTVRERMANLEQRVHWYGNSQRFNDSYNWSLIKIIASQQGRPLFDYCFLDGAHTVAVDALNFFLADRLLHVGGYMDFDDYQWRLRGSSLDPAAVPAITLQYTDEQIDSFQVKLIVDELVRRDSRYEEVVTNKIFRKVKP